MNEREVALERVSKALPALQKIDELYNTALNIDQQNMAMQTNEKSSSSRRGNILGAISALVTWYVLDMIYIAIARSGKLTGGIAGVFILFSIIAAIAVFFTVRKKLSVPQKKVAEVVSRNTDVMQSISAQIKEIAEDNADAINAMPRDYRYYYAVQFFEQALSNERADSMKEAINLYEEQLHREKLENYNRQMLFNNQRQSEMLSSIENSSRSAARGANVAAAFSILNFMK